MRPPAPSGLVAEPLIGVGNTAPVAVRTTDRRAGNIIWYALAAMALLGGVLMPHEAVANAVAAAGGTAGLAGGFLLLRVLLISCAVLFVAVARYGLGTSSVGLMQPVAATRLDRRELVVLGALLLIATALRINALGAGLWHDEIATLISNVRPPLVAVLTSFESQNNHPLYSILAKLTTTLFGESTFALRLPAVLFGVGSIAALYWLGVQLNRSREALLAAALLTVAYHHVWFSQNARAYTALLCFALIGTGLCIRLCQPRAAGARTTAVAYALVMTLAVYSHLTAALIVVGHALVWLVAIIASGNWRGAWRSAPALAFALSGLFALMLYAPGLPQIASGLGGGAGTSNLEWKNPLWLLAETTRGLARSVPGGLLSLAIAAIAPAAGLISYLQRDRLVTALMIVPVVITALALLATGHNLWPRFFFFAAGFAVLILLRGIFALAARQRWFPAERVASVAALLLIAGGAVLTPAAWGRETGFCGSARIHRRCARNR